MLFRMRADVQVRIVRLRSSLNHLGSVVTSPRLGAPSFTFSPVQVWPLQPFDAAERGDCEAPARLGPGRSSWCGHPLLFLCCAGRRPRFWWSMAAYEILGEFWP